MLTFQKVKYFAISSSVKGACRYEPVLEPYSLTTRRPVDIKHFTHENIDDDLSISY